MRVYKHTLDIVEFEKDFSHLIRFRDDKETVLNEVLARVNATDAKISTFLKDVDSIEDKEIQQCCRCAAIAQMYHVKPKSIASQSNWVLVIQCKRQNVDEIPVYSEAVVSKYGELIIDEGVIAVYTQANYGGGWPVKNIADGKFGFISSYGDYLLPCSFDTFYSKLGVGPYFFLTRWGSGIGGVPMGVVPFRTWNTKDIAFQLRIYGKQSNLAKERIEQLLDYYSKERFIICRSKEGVLCVLMAEDSVIDSNGELDWDHDVDITAYQDALKEVKAFMSPFIVAQEELKQLIGD